MPNKKYILRYHLGDNPWQEYTLTADATYLGRDRSCAVILDHPLVSRRHAALIWEGDTLWLQDLGSTNGVGLEGLKMAPNTRSPLRPGQVFQIGGFRLEIVAPDMPQEKETSLTEMESLQPATQLEPPLEGTQLEAAPMPVAKPPSPPPVAKPPVQSPVAKPPTPPPVAKPIAPARPPVSSLRLGYRLGNGPWVENPLKDGIHILGRQPDCEFLLNDELVSRRHARLEVKGSEFWVMDLGSTNGTQVEGQPLSPRRQAPIRPGQVFTIGAFTLCVLAPGMAAPVLQGAQMPVAQVPGAPAPAAVAYKDEAGKVHLGAPEQGVMQTMMGVPMPSAPLEMHTLDLQKFDRITIGRASDNQVVINHPMVSRYHASLERVGTRYLLKDLRSANGVFVNNVRIERETWLKEGDEIRVGPFGFSISGNNFRPHVEAGLRLDVHGLKQRVSAKLNLLQSISLMVEPMEFVALVGMSGSGKTTLLNAISGYRPATDGAVLVNNTNLYQNYDQFRNEIGYVPQKDIVHAELTPETALGYVAKLRMPPDTTQAERDRVVAEVLETLGLTERKNVPISRLSGGQLKRVSIGVELLTKPRLFFLDEPTSGLDPGTEADMMRLLRRLADQGRTVILITHATKNVMLCDKVIFLARGGYMAFFGAPEEALEYFDEFRTARERREKGMEFDDIYRILSDETRGAPKEWSERYQASPYFANTGVAAGKARPAVQAAAPTRTRVARVSAMRQFFILSARNIKILTQDKVSLGLMLALAPMIGLMDFMWGKKLFDPVEGDATRILTMWFMAALITVLVGAMSSVREIVKEVDIYKRERAVNLKVGPYVLSKIWVGVVLGSYQAGVLLLCKVIFARPEVPSASSYVALYITLLLGTICGYMIGLAISAGAPNQNAALLLIIVVLVPQFLFAGALLPLDLIPGGEAISLMMPTRWIFESFTRITELGSQLTTDPCWELPKADRVALAEEQKVNCPCMGANIFTMCNTFPGILDPDYYNAEAAARLAQPKPLEPPMPTAYPQPTPYPSPTPLPTPTLLPSPTPLPTPADPREMGTYMDERQGQGDQYQDEILGQFDQYRVDSQDQGKAYSDERTMQGDEYATLRQQQGDEYSTAMRIYGDERAAWQEAREKAIGSAEALLGTIYDNYSQALKGSVYMRWGALLIINFVLLVAVLFFQKRKDVV